VDINFKRKIIMNEDENDKIIDFFEKEQIKAQKNIAHFWEYEYKEKSYHERIKYWCNRLHRQYRWNEESGIDGMAVFSKEDYLEWKQKETEIDIMLPEIIKMAGLNYEKVLEALKN
jgi:hypothetical protein